MGLGTPYALVATRLRTGAVDRLTARLRRVGLDDVLGNLDRTALPCHMPGTAVGNGFAWDEDDGSDPA